MLWQGYASRLKVILKEYQLQVMNAYCKKRDILVIQGTGSGKSTCFALPIMMFPEDSDGIGLIIVPTNALAMNHQQSFASFDINSVVFNADSNLEDYQKTFEAVADSSNRVRAVILTSEFLFGLADHPGILSRFQRRSTIVNFIAIDEAHLMYDWVSFRPAYGKIKQLKTLFDCPIMALSATFKPSSQKSVCADVLRHPVVVQWSIDRPNVMLNILPYRRSLSKTEGNSFEPVCKLIKEITEEEPTIVYCIYAKECTKLNKDLTKLGVNSLEYTGKLSLKEKREVYEKVIDGEKKILVATKAFGQGIKISSVRHIFLLGLPKSLSDFMQAAGRAGRDGKKRE